MNMIFKACEKCSQCGEVRGRILSLQYDFDADEVEGEIDLCSDCVNRYIEGKVKFD